MMKFVADSSSDRPVIPGMEVQYVPMMISTDEKSFVDNEHLNVSEMLDYLAEYKGRSYTACPSVDGWLTACEGGDEIYAVTITSGLSSPAARAAAIWEKFIFPSRIRHLLSSSLTRRMYSPGEMDIWRWNRAVRWEALTPVSLATISTDSLS